MKALKIISVAIIAFVLLASVSLIIPAMADNLLQPRPTEWEKAADTKVSVQQTRIALTKTMEPYPGIPTITPSPTVDPYPYPEPVEDDLNWFQKIIERIRVIWEMR